LIVQASTGSREARRQRIAELRFDYHGRPKEHLTACNLCRGRTFVGLTHTDRYGYPANAQGCLRCGLVFLNPVMTADAYREFYADVYRPLVSAYHGRLINAETIQVEQEEYARDRAQLLKPYLKSGGCTTLLDIGGSTGVVAHHLARSFDLRATVLDPSPLEIEQAKRFGLETITGLLEDFDPKDRRFDLITLCQTVDHILDVAGAMRKISAVLAPGGVFFVDIVYFRAAYLRHWSVEEAIKIDHPYYLTEATMESFLSQAGFDLLGKDYAADHLHISYVCRRGEVPQPRLPERDAVADLWHEIRTVQNAPRGG
jgi:SAM-dependent methyltransferase